MDIGREVRRFVAEPVMSPVPGERPVVEEPEVTEPVVEHRVTEGAAPIRSR